MKNQTLQALTRQYQQIIKNPQNYDAMFELALIHYQHQQYQQALTYFIKAYEKNHKISISSQYIANIHYYSNQYEKAIEWYQISLKANPTNDSPYNSIGVIYKKLGRIQQALSYFHKCLEMNPKNSLAHYAIANIFYDLKDYSQAQIHYDQSIEFNPNYDAPYIGRGNILKRLGKYDEASKEYLKGLYLNPKNEAALINLRNLPLKITNSIDLELKQVENPYEVISQNNKVPIHDIQPEQKHQVGLQIIKKTHPIIRRKAMVQKQTDDLEKESQISQLRSIKSEFTNMFSEIATFFKGQAIHQQPNTNKHIQLTSKSNQSLLSARDRQLIIQIDCNDEQDQLQSVQNWIQRLVNQVVSTSFNFYLNGQMTYNQARIYCCQKILTNIYLFVSKRYHQLKRNIMNKINKFMQQSLQYIKYKYPLNEELEVPYKLEHFISSNKKDNTDSIQYDYFCHYPYDYQYRQSGVYNDIIMKMINNLINTTNTNYYSFKETMTKLFENVFDPTWKNQEADQTKKRKNSVDKPRNQSPQSSKSPYNSKSPEHSKKQSHQIHKMNSQHQIIANTSMPMVNTSIFNMNKSHDPNSIQMTMSQNAPSMQAFQQKRRQQHQKNRKKREHRQKVQSYTSYIIKRKIPQFVKCYSEEEIRNINDLKVKDKSIFRILTKWCQQLWQKFDLSGYFLNKINVLMLKDKKLFYLSLDHKEELDRLISQEKIQIKKFIEKISKDCNMKMQFHLLTRWVLYEDQLQNNTGIFTANVVQSLQYFTVSYLNRLIHGLLKVSKKFSSRVLDETHPQLLLLTFRIKDLLRCRFKSKEQQSEKVLRHILEETEMTVLRVKNRLNDNNNDIMINLFFSNMICEIQLAVQTNTSKFIECSNNFNHFLYQLQRSYFGPITQMSNIWQCHDKRMKHYKKIQEKRVEAFKPISNHCSHSFQKLSDDSEPFICSNCNRIYYHYNYIIPHKICLKCKAINCGNCQLSSMSSEVLKKKLKIGFDARYTDIGKSFPKLSYFLLKECSSQQLGVYFIRYQKRSKKYLISIKNSNNHLSFELISELSQKTIKSLLKKYVIVEMPHNYEQIIYRNKIQQTLFTQYIKQSLSEQKDELSLSDFILGDEHLKNILNEQLHANQMNFNYCKVKKLIIDRINQTKIKKENMDSIVSQFTNLKYLWIANNQLDHLPKLSDPAKIIMINLQKTELKLLQKHSQFQKLTNLQFLIINNSHLKEIPSLKHIEKLAHLQICNSNIKHLHDSIFKHMGPTLVYLNLSVNKLQKLPQSIKDLRKLEYLNVSNNNLLLFPHEIVFNIALSHLNLSENTLRIIPENLQNLINLQTLDLSNCNLTTISAQFSRLIKLKKINLSSNKLHSLHFLQNSKISKEVFLSHSCQQSLAHCEPKDLHFWQISNCQKLVLNSLALGETLSQIKFINIKELTINLCNFTVFPDIYQCHELKILDLSGNLIDEILEEDFEGLYQLEQLILNQNPLRVFPASFEELEKLNVLQVQNCGLRGVPAFTKLGKLTTLKIGYNHFTSLPNTLFESLPNIRILDVRNNTLDDIIRNQLQQKQQQNDATESQCHQGIIIGDRIDLLKQLQQLYLGSCSLGEIPKNIQRCTKLRVLRLQQNKISYIPKRLQKLKNIRILRVDCNSLSTMKDIQILSMPHAVLPSIAILKDLLVDYSAKQDDEQQKIAISAFAQRFSSQINEVMIEKQLQIIKKYGQNIIKDTSLLHILLKIQSQYSTVQGYLNKIHQISQLKAFNERHIQSIKYNLRKRLADIEQEEFKILQQSRLTISNYQICYKQFNLSTKNIHKQQSKTIESKVEKYLHKIIKDTPYFQHILQKTANHRPIILNSLRQLMQLSLQSSINIDISIRYYPNLEQLIMPIDVKEATLVENQVEGPSKKELLQFSQQYQFYRFNTAKVKDEILQNSYLNSSQRPN